MFSPAVIQRDPRAHSAPGHSRLLTSLLRGTPREHQTMTTPNCAAFLCIKSEESCKTSPILAGNLPPLSQG